MKQGLSLRISQHLALTPQLQQSIRLLQLSTLELSQEIEQMLEANPFLEVDHEAAEREDFGIEQVDAQVSLGDRVAELAPASAVEQSSSASDVTDDTTTPLGADDDVSWDGDGTHEIAPDDSEWGGDAKARANNLGDDEQKDATELARSQESLTAFLHRQALGMRLADTDLILEVEADYTLRAGSYGEEVKFGGGKTIRDGMAQSQRSNTQGAVDTVLTNALII